MKFSFNHVTDEARQKLEDLGIRCEKETPSAWSVWTNTLDRIIDNLLERDLSISESAILKEYASQGERIWKHKDTGVYYYLWNDTVFWMRKDIHSDYSTIPPTSFEVSILDIVTKENQGAIRERLLSVPPNADIEHGGVLI